MSIYKGGKLIAGLSISYHPDLFDWKWADHKLNDVQWLRADSFSWHNADVYQAAYQHLADDILGKTLQSETISGTTIQFYLADDGHKICPASEESNVQAIYSATGVAWYYIIDTTNERFKLPRAKHNKYTESLSVVGTGKVLGLTNGTDTFALNSGATYARLTIGYNAGQNVASSGGYDAGYNVNWRIGVSKDPTYSGLTTSSMEQETDQYKYLYFYVGAFTQSALENTAGIATEDMNNKLDLDLGNASASTKQEIAALCFPDFTSPTRTGLSLNTSYQAESNGYVKISASTGGDIYSLTRVSIQVSNDNSTFSVVAANAAYSTGGQHVLIAPVRRGQYFKGTGSSGSMEFFSI